MLLSCGLASWNLLSPVLIPIFYITRSHIDQASAQNKVAFPFFFNLTMFIGEFIGGVIFECLSLIINKTIGLTKCWKQKRKRKVIIAKILTKERKTSPMAYFILLFIAFLDGLCLTIESFLASVENGNSLTILSKPCMLLFTCVLSKYLLGIPLYKHHLYSLILIFIGYIISIIKLFSPVSEIAYFIAYCFVGLINSLLMTFYFIAQKHLMERELMEPFRIVLYQGVIGAIFTLAFTALMNLPCTSMSNGCKFTFAIDNVFDAFRLFFNDSYGAFILFASILCSGLINILGITTSKLYTPSHTSVCQSFCFVLTIVVFIWKNKDVGSLPFFITGDVMLIVGCLFYFEFIILNWRDFGENTQKEIMRRGIDDKHLFIQDMRELNGV